MKKYEITNEFINVNNKKLYRIKALKDFSYVIAGDLGGYIESEDNLSQLDNCWIYHNSKVYDRAKVYDNAMIFNNAEVYDYAEVYGDAMVFNDVIIYDNAKVFNNVRLFNNARIFNNAEVYDCAKVCDHARIYGNAKAYDYAEVYCHAKVYDNAKVYNCADVYGYANVCGNVEITTKATNLRNCCKWDITMTDNHLIVGCKVKTYDEWIDWLDNSTEEFYTPRNTKKFKLIDNAVRFAVNLHKLRKE